MLTNSTSNITQLPWTVEPGGLHDAKCGVDAVEAKLMMKHRGGFRGSVSVGDRLSLHTLASSHCLGFSAVQVLRLHNTADGGISQQCEITVFNSPTSVFLTARIMWGTYCSVEIGHNYCKYSSQSKWHKCYQTICCSFIKPIHRLNTQ